jgi:hypothetical protein
MGGPDAPQIRIDNCLAKIETCDKIDPVNLNLCQRHGSQTQGWSRDVRCDGKVVASL